MTMSELTSAFEAVLFSGGEPQSIDRFSQVFDIAPEKVVKVMESLEKKLKEQKSGLELLRLDNTCQSGKFHKEQDLEGGTCRLYKENVRYKAAHALIPRRA